MENKIAKLYFKEIFIEIQFMFITDTGDDGGKKKKKKKII